MSIFLDSDFGRNDEIRNLPRRRSTGLTLIELIVFIVIVSVALAGILAVMNTVVKGSADPMVRKQALAAAESLLEEILLKDFSNPSGGYTGSDRSQFDDVSDYNGFAMPSGVNAIDGTPISGLGGYSVSVSVDAAASLGGIGGGEVKRVAVTVTGPGNETIALSGYRTNYAP